MAKKPQKRASNTSAKVATHNVSVAKTTSARSATAEFDPDYSYIKKDLKRIGVLAGSFFVVLVALSFFLR